MNRATLKVTTPSDREILVTRVFDAPRALVWDAFTQPELLKRWITGPPGWSMVSCDNELKVGSTYRWDWQGPDGSEMRMRGVYREIVRHERIVRTESFELGCNDPAGEQVGTLVLHEMGGGGGGGATSIALKLLFQSKEARDASLASGMEHGMAMGYQRLDEILSMTLSPRGSQNAA